MKTCILSIQRYENIKDIEEWLDYHFNLGFDHIFLMDNNDEKDALQINKDNLTIIPYYGQRNDGTDWVWQREAYTFGIEYIKQFDYDWISIIDIDEFITLFNHNNIQDFIQEECINKGFDNIELIWQLYNDDNKIYHKDEYNGNILNTYQFYFQPDINKVNTKDKFCYMRGYTKFIGKIKPELYYKESAHYPANELYDNDIYKWNVCDPNIAVLKHYKYKSLEDFISLKCKQRNYVTSPHGSTWKYSRTYFEDNYVSINKIFHFIMFDYKYKLNMEKWDIEYLQDLLKKLIPKNQFGFDIWFGKNIKNDILTHCINSRNKSCKDFYFFHLNETNLNLDICPYIRFMYDHKLYGMCADFFKCLFLYYFGGLYCDRDVEFLTNFDLYFENNDYILFNYGAKGWFTMEDIPHTCFISSKPFNPLFKYFIDYCDKFTYEELENMYNSMSQKDFMDNFYDTKIMYKVIKENNINIKVINNINEKIQYKENELIIFENYLLEPYKYKIDNIQTIAVHYNLKTHEQIYFNNK